MVGSVVNRMIMVESGVIERGMVYSGVITEDGKFGCIRFDIEKNRLLPTPISESEGYG